MTHRVRETILLKTMSVLIALPEDLFFEILQEWLHTKQIGFLDLACCNKILRPPLLKQLKSLLNFSYLVCKPSFYEWVYLRDIKLQCLKLVDDCFDESGINFKVKHENIGKIIYNSGSIVAISNLINSCHNITSLDMVFWSFNASILENVTVLKQIKHLSLNCNNLDYGKLLTRLIQECTQLRSYVHNGYSTNTKHLHKQLFLNNPLLRVIETTATVSLAKIRECCPNIETVKVTIDTVDIADLQALFAVVKQLNVTLHQGTHKIIYTAKSNSLELISHHQWMSSDLSDPIISATHGVKILVLNAVEVADNSIEHLSVSIESVDMNNAFYTLNTMKCLLTKCNHLHTIHIPTTRITGEELAQLFQQVKPTALRNLYLKFIWLSVADALTIIWSCICLNSFRVNNSKVLTDADVAAFRDQLCNTEKPLLKYFCVENILSQPVLKIVNGIIE